MSVFRHCSLAAWLQDLARDDSRTGLFMLVAALAGLLCFKTGEVGNLYQACVE